ncbi:hypothetical protein [Streptomyces sp. NPDC052114]|uniref:hypothetical protein n=1 Tax=unclassified Streptomyces TaxID=2593676 RepID=UPI003412F6AB
MSVKQPPVSLLSLPSHPLKVLGNGLTFNLQARCLNCTCSAELCRSQGQCSTSDRAGNRRNNPNASRQHRSHSLIHTPYRPSLRVICQSAMLTSWLAPKGSCRSGGLASTA